MIGPKSARSSPRVVASAIITALSFIVWAALLATLADLGGSDAAGNGLAQAFAGLETVLLWLLLAALLIIAGMAGAIPKLAMLAAVLLTPASGFASIVALDLLSAPGQPPYLWPIVTPACAPPAIVAFCFWALSPSLRSRVPARVATSGAWGLIGILCVAMVPMDQVRNRVMAQAAMQRDRWATDFAKVAPDAPLRDWTLFLRTPDSTREQAVIERIRRLEHRQADAETMLAQGAFPLRYLGSFDLDLTPALCEKAHWQLRRNAGALVPKTADTRPYAEVAEAVAGAAAAMEWLVGHGCACDQESAAWEAMANAYHGTNFDIVRLAELRDPRVLGRALREDPERFSMLTPQAPLRAWLKFADEPPLREKALTGARALDHRTDDAVDMLRADEFSANTVLRYLPELALDAAPPFCDAALTALHGQFSGVYRPREEDPRPYQELLARLGRAEPLTALRWIASHGCAADDELNEAEIMVRSYQDSPARAAMLADLVELHRKP